MEETKDVKIAKEDDTNYTTFANIMEIEVENDNFDDEISDFEDSIISEIENDMVSDKVLNTVSESFCGLEYLETDFIAKYQQHIEQNMQKKSDVTILNE